MILISAVIALTGCAAPSRYMGISLKPGAADAAIQQQARQAMAGDKQVQYELGRWFENSADPDDLIKSIKLYQIAAAPLGGSRMMYTPGPSGVTTSVVSTGPKIEGNEAAQTRLRQLKLSRENQNEFNNTGQSIEITDRKIKNDWFKLKNRYSCNKFNSKPSECNYLIIDFPPNNIKVEDILNSSDLIIDISGRLFCNYFCIYENKKFMIYYEIESSDHIFLYIYKKKKLLGIIVRSYFFYEKKSDKLYLSSYGSRFIYSDIRKIMYSYGMSDGGEVK
ncbi:hypothetical protein [Sphingorhabdus sp.]|uniref:hypothetical protein n=1 Tax=Sphingorhabdus sp. TaxID=1902408 RepID=UPI003983734E